MSDDRYVLLPQPIEEEALQILYKHNFKVIQAENPDPETVTPLMKNAKAIVLRTGIKMTQSLIDKAKDLWTISRTGAGVDNVDLEAASKKEVIVTSSIGVNTGTVVEHDLSLMFALFKQLFLMDREVRNGNFKIRYKNYPRDLHGKTLGIVGFGRIGSEIAKKSSQLFNMKIVAYDEYLSEEKKRALESWVRFISLEELFKESDVVSIHLPLNSETMGMINFKLLGIMKKSAFLINTSRGGVIDEDDLVKVLRENTISGAGLDVFEKEPLELNNPLFTLDNVILTPHTAALTKECVVRMATSAVKRVIDILNGYIPDNIANPEVLKTKRWKNLKEK